MDEIDLLQQFPGSTLTKRLMTGAVHLNFTLEGGRERSVRLPEADLLKDRKATIHVACLYLKDWANSM